MSSEEAVHDQLTADLYMRSLHEDRQPLTTPQSGGLAVSVYREVHCAACFSNSIALQTIGDLFCRSSDHHEKSHNLNYGQRPKALMYPNNHIMHRRCKRRSTSLR
ncbi:hypothetical protein CUC08_Gglean005114 [Alternaria sp. MG1]|nr:hypothetical protein CUC08_Gglean005114 [Alternaria sp. MG1]